MVFGTIFLGKVKEMNKQWVETKFIVIGIPIFPTSSMLVTASSHNRRQGINIPLNTTSVIAGYARLLTFISALAFLFMGSGYFQIIGIILGILWAYFYFKFGKVDQNEIAERTKLGRSIGIYALPNWFSFDDAITHYKNLHFHYKEKFQNSDWKTDLASSIVPQEKRPALYALALFNYMIDQSGENEILLNKADSIYK